MGKTDHSVGVDSREIGHEQTVGNDLGILGRNSLDLQNGSNEPVNFLSSDSHPVFLSQPVATSLVEHDQVVVNGHVVGHGVARAKAVAAAVIPAGTGLQGLPHALSDL